MENIYELQMKQFAESVHTIKTDPENKTYVIQFDPSDAIDQLILNKEQYTNFIEFRDHKNCVCVFDRFLEKVHSYYNSSPAEKVKVVKKKEKIQVAKKVEVNYDHCHHCKQRKPEECMIRCKSGRVPYPKAKEQKKVYNINGTTVVKRNLN